MPPQVTQKQKCGACFSLLDLEVYHDSNQIKKKKAQISNKNLLSFPVGGNVPRKTYSSTAVTVVFLELLEPTHYPWKYPGAEGWGELAVMSQQK